MGCVIVQVLVACLGFTSESTVLIYMLVLIMLVLISGSVLPPTAPTLVMQSLIWGQGEGASQTALQQNAAHAECFYIVFCTYILVGPSLNSLASIVSFVHIFRFYIYLHWC
jgi:hypothetical protein